MLKVGKAGLISVKLWLGKPTYKYSAFNSQFCVMPYSMPAPAVHPVSVFVTDPAIAELDAVNSTD